MLPPIIAAALLAFPGSAARPIAAYGRWGAFREGARCFAISEPITARRGGRPSAGFTLAAGMRPQLHLRLSRSARGDRPAVVEVGGRVFPLVVRGLDAWPRDARADARIVAAVRGGERLEVRAHDDRTRRFRDLYPLAGAASAIDAAALACLSR